MADALTQVREGGRHVERNTSKSCAGPWSLFFFVPPPPPPSGPLLLHPAEVLVPRGVRQLGLLRHDGVLRRHPPGEENCPIRDGNTGNPLYSTVYN